MLYIAAIFLCYTSLPSSYVIHRCHLLMLYIAAIFLCYTSLPSSYVIHRCHLLMLYIAAIFLCYTSLPSSYVIHRCHLLGSFRMASRNHSFGVSRHHSWTVACSGSLPLNSPYPVAHIAACRCFLSTPTMNIGCFKAFLPQNSCRPFLSIRNAFYFATTGHALRSLDLAMTQQFS